MFPVGGLGVLAGGAGLAPLFEVDSRRELVLTGGAVVAGADVEEWRGRGPAGALIQDTAGTRPVTDGTIAPGRLVVAFADAEHLEAAIASDPLTLVVVFDAPDAPPLGDRVLLTRDTSSGATSKAAFEVSLISYFG